MKKIKKKSDRVTKEGINKKELKKLLKDYWIRMMKLEMEFYKKIGLLEEEMNNAVKKYNLPQLSFFAVDGEYVGIGAENWEDRKDFELIHDSELEE